MDADRVTDRYFLPVLIAGFVLAFLLLLISGAEAVASMRFIEGETRRLVSEQRATAKLINEVQSEEGNLSNVFYSLASGQNTDTAALMKRLAALEAAIHRTTDTGSVSEDRELWSQVRLAADAFIAVGRETIRTLRPPSEEFYQRHQVLLAALAALTGSNFNASDALRRETERVSSRVRYSVMLIGAALVVAVAGAFFTVIIVNRMYRRLAWQTAELRHLSSRTMSHHEEMARRLSREMHDHFGQTLSAIEANLVALHRGRVFHQGRIEDCLGLVKDAVENVREVSHLLRPTILDDFGLTASLRWLADGFAERTGKRVRFSSSFDGRLDDEAETQIFRIAQEALTNVARHSGATEVTMGLTATRSWARLTVADNGNGIQNEGKGMGLVGMRARARAAGGKMSLVSQAGRGVCVTVELPLERLVHDTEDSHPAGR
jgi:signal transduction histidine kinase